MTCQYINKTLDIDGHLSRNHYTELDIHILKFEIAKQYCYSLM